MSCRFWVEEGRNFVKWNRSGRKRNKKPQSIICKQCTRCDRQTPSWQALKTGADVTSEMEAEGMHGEPFQLKQRSLAPCASANTSQPWCGKKAHTEARETRRLLLGCSRVAKVCISRQERSVVRMRTKQAWCVDFVQTLPLSISITDGIGLTFCGFGLRRVA